MSSYFPIKDPVLNFVEQARRATDADALRALFDRHQRPGTARGQSMGIG